MKKKKEDDLTARARELEKDPDALAQLFKDVVKGHRVHYGNERKHLMAALESRPTKEEAAKIKEQVAKIDTYLDRVKNIKTD